MTQVAINRIDGLMVPRSFGMRRNAPPRSRVTSEEFWDRYDSTTLFYMAIYDVATKELNIYAPPLLNFLSLVRRAQFFLDGSKLSTPRINHYKKFDLIVFKPTSPGRKMTIILDDTEIEMPVFACDPARFAGRRVVYTLSKNNELAWIRDWMVWNQRNHKADAVLFVDNDSTNYEVEALAATLAGVAGYIKTDVVQVPFRYGPDLATAEFAGDGDFLQISLMNAFWMMSLRYARAMLNVDVDELIVSEAGEAIFDAVDTARYGIVMASGRWGYASPDNGAVRHLDHTLVLEGDKPCPPKYCLRPNGFAARQKLKVHGVNHFKLMPFVSRNKFSFLHCRNISTSWRYERSRFDCSAMSEDLKTKALLTQVFL